MRQKCIGKGRDDVDESLNAYHPATEFFKDQLDYLSRDARIALHTIEIHHLTPKETSTELFTSYHTDSLELAKNEQNRLADDAFLRDKATFYSLLPSLLKNEKYSGKYVAICDGKIAGTNTDDAKLAIEIYEKKGNVPMYIAKVTKERVFYEEPSSELQ